MADEPNKTGTINKLVDNAPEIVKQTRFHVAVYLMHASGRIIEDTINYGAPLGAIADIGAMPFKYARRKYNQYRGRQ